MKWILFPEIEFLENGKNFCGDLGDFIVLYI